MENHSQHYTEQGFWDKVYSVAKLAGRQVIEKALILFFCLTDNQTPAWAKIIIIGALGYFISPIDAVPDFFPFVGYSDDLAVLIAAIQSIAIVIKHEHYEKANQKLNEWFR